MTYSDYQITIEEYSEFIASKKPSEQLQNIWNDIILRIMEEDVQKEVKNHSFTFESDPDKEDDPVADYKIIIPEGPEEIKEYFRQNVYSSVVCLKI